GLGLVLPVFADDDPVKTEPAPVTTPVRKDGRKVAELAERFKVPEQQVSDLRAKGLGWGEVSHALGIAQKAGVPVADVMKLRDSGMGWGRIAKNYGFKMGDVASGKHAAPTQNATPAPTGTVEPAGRHDGGSHGRGNGG